MSRYLPLICLAVAHTLVDTCAQFVEPLWPMISERYSLIGVGSLSVAFIVQSLPSSIAQAVFGYLRDLSHLPWLVWAGPIVGVLGMTLLGFTETKIGLGLLLILGGLGIGAFHPEAVVLAGRLVPEHRTRAISIFMLGGACGLAIGPIVSGAIVRSFGLKGLAWLCIPMVLLVFLLLKIGQWGDRQNESKHLSQSRSFSEMFEGRGKIAMALFLICSLRLVPNMGMNKVLSFVLYQRGYDQLGIGLHQSLFLFSAGAGMFLIALRFRPGWEKRFMIFCPLAGVPFLGILGWNDCPQWLFLVSICLLGLAIWGTSPAMVSYAQQLFPKGAGFASALTMGVSWGMGGLIQAPITAYYSGKETPELACWVFLPCLLLASLGACFLPGVNSQARPAGENQRA